jgi:FG-GAP-like repeat
MCTGPRRIAHARFRRLSVLMPSLVILLLCGVAAQSDMRFAMVQIDGGAAESAAVADFNKDGKLDLVSADSWYEAPRWTKRPIRTIPVVSGYVDSFSDLPLDVDGDGFIDVIQIGYFARRMVWMKNPGPSGSVWTEHLIDAIGPTEFAFLVDLDNDGKADDLLPQFTGAAGAPLTWYEIQNGAWVKHIVSTRSYGHGIGAGDVNGDKRNDILTPHGWLEAPSDPRAPGTWTLHATDWQQRTIPAPTSAASPSLATPPAMATPPTVVPPASPSAATNTAVPAPATRGAEWGFLHVLDINGDGRNDVLTTSAHSYGICWFEQRADGGWEQHVIDHSWSHAHASVLTDINGNGRPDLVSGKRFQARNAPAPGGDDPLGIYWYEFTQGASNAVTWTRHTIDYGSKAGGGLQMAVRDIDGDGDIDVVSGGKSGLFLAENLTRRPSNAAGVSTTDRWTIVTIAEPCSDVRLECGIEIVR